MPEPGTPEASAATRRYEISVGDRCAVCERRFDPKNEAADPIRYLPDLRNWVHSRCWD